MLRGILHSGVIATLNRKSKQRADHSAGPGTAPSRSRLCDGAGRKSTGSSGFRLLDQFTAVVRGKHNALRTEKPYRHWIATFLRSHRGPEA
ncbi:MAG: hypothetical protein IID34_09040 [Planctomycetes bacterium]|nr:hypothetical protein [Planctomycetota bacterium]